MDPGVRLGYDEAMSLRQPLRPQPVPHFAPTPEPTTRTLPFQQQPQQHQGLNPHFNLGGISGRPGADMPGGAAAGEAAGAGEAAAGGAEVGEGLLAAAAALL